MSRLRWWFVTKRRRSLRERITQLRRTRRVLVRNMTLLLGQKRDPSSKKCLRAGRRVLCRLVMPRLKRLEGELASVTGVSCVG